MYLIYNNDVTQIVDFQHVSPGKGGAFVRTKLKSIKNGKVIEYTFKSGDKFEDANVETNDAQYLYDDGKNYVFMDNVTYDQFELEHNALGKEGQYLIDGLEVMILKRNGFPISVRLPRKIQYKVITAPPGTKGDTATSATKTIILENNLEVTVPLFVKEGDVVVINTDAGTYVERV
jgi:elongation factor P